MPSLLLSFVFGLVFPWGGGFLLCLSLAAVFGLGWVWGIKRRARIAGENSRQRNFKAQAGEQEAEKLLEDYGFEILETQLAGIWWMEIDGELAEVEVRADLLVVERETGEQFVAEVKTGTQAPDPLFAATRRQLLEYSLVFDPLGVLLVDVAAARIYEVAFPGEVPVVPEDPSSTNL